LPAVGTRLGRVADDERRNVFTHPGLVRFWTASAVSDFGGYITTIALQVLVVLTLDGSAADVGFLNASRWLPYLLFGLVVGALVDRRRRQPILVAGDVDRGILLAGIPMLWLVGRGQTRSATSRSPSPVLGANAQRPCHAPWPRLCMSPPSMTYVALVT